MDELQRIKKKHGLIKKKEFNSNKILFAIIITLLVLIGMKSNKSFKDIVNRYLFEENISFTKINNLYQKYFGSFFPTLEEDTKEVFNEKISYKEKSKYLDGVKLVVDKNYLVPSLKGGLVVFIGDKDNYKNLVIVQGTDGVDIWYSNITNISVKLYDYISENTYLGNSLDDEIYLLFKKDGEIISYEDYL